MTEYIAPSFVSVDLIREYPSAVPVRFIAMFNSLMLNSENFSGLNLAMVIWGIKALGGELIPSAVSMFLFNADSSFVASAVIHIRRGSFGDGPNEMLLNLTRVFGGLTFISFSTIDPVSDSPASHGGIRVI